MKARHQGDLEVPCSCDQGWSRFDRSTPLGRWLTARGVECRHCQGFGMRALFVPTPIDLLDRMVEIVEQGLVASMARLGQVLAWLP